MAVPKKKLAELTIQALIDPEWEARVIHKLPLRGRQVEVIQRVEAHVRAHNGGVMTVKLPRQTGKNQVSAILQRRHLMHRRFSPSYQCWIRTAPTHKPQIVNSKKRLREVLAVGDKNLIKYPLMKNEKLIKEEGYIWRVGNAAIEFLSSGPEANVVGATASTALDMDEAHKVDKDKFDEDFMPFTANTNAATILWGVGGNGLDTLQHYSDLNKASGNEHLNICIPCDYWMETHEPYRKHVESRVNALGWDHPIIRTQYKLESIAALGSFLNQMHINTLFSGTHERHRSPRDGVHYEMLVDIAAGNEEFNPDDILQGVEDVATDSSAIWIYEVTNLVASNGLFPIILIRDVIWLTGNSLASTEAIIKSTIESWNIQKATIDSVGVGRQIGESIKKLFGENVVNAYVASDTTVSEDCYGLLARLNSASVFMFANDNSKEFEEIERQAGWTQYQASKGKMKLRKPKADKHIDLIKALTYINQNNPTAGVGQLFFNEGDYGI